MLEVATGRRGVPRVVAIAGDRTISDGAQTKNAIHCFGRLYATGPGDPMYVSARSYGSRPPYDHDDENYEEVGSCRLAGTTAKNVERASRR